MSNTFDVTSALSVTTGARFNYADIRLADTLGFAPDLAGHHTFMRVNPVVGATYKVVPGMTAYAGLFGSEPRADAARARLRQSRAAVPDRERAGGRPAAPPGGRPHRRGGPARRRSGRFRTDRLQARRLPHRERERHHPRGELHPGARLFHQRGGHAPSGPGGERAGEGADLASFRQLLRSSTRPTSSPATSPRPTTRRPTRTATST